MTGLEKIVKRIEEDAVVVAAAVITGAEDKAIKIAEAAQSESELKRSEIEERSIMEVNACISRGESAANLVEKKLTLSAKQEIIGNVITGAKEMLIQLPEEEYFEVIEKMVQKYALEKSGQIMFSTRDKKRLPKTFIDSLKSNLTISEKEVNIDGGFILVYGDVEENCSFDALFFATRESLQDQVCDVLFA